jgi:mono/diheme cytochrome c family protein
VFSWSLMSAARAQHDPKAHRHQDAQALVNPLKPTADVLAAGRKVYDRHCLDCHGEEGKGDGMAGETLKPRPSDFTDAAWQHGSSDGEIFTVARDGAGEGMKGFKGKLTDQQLWQVVTFIKSLHKAP